ncbi:MAG: hypothetical protein FD165_1717 [Gammaproteobacteria bacterium]|nr:MAG: hypothetical protein FD165_1717 [Gammaproteobacteria bacterium]
MMVAGIRPRAREDISGFIQSPIETGGKGNQT